VRIIVGRGDAASSRGFYGFCDSHDRRIRAESSRIEPLDEPISFAPSGVATLAWGSFSGDVAFRSIVATFEAAEEASIAQKAR
jgi:hypothetical protein